MKFSIIIPVYNGEKHLIQCFDNIKDLDYKDIEIIFVNDGSTDKSKSMLEDFALNNKKVVIINQDKNAGVGFAYETAFNAMTGDYISFNDCDDLLSKNMYTELSSLIKRYDNPDIIHFGAKWIDEDGFFIKNFKSLNKYISDDNSKIIRLHYETLHEPVLGFRVFKKKLFNNIFCPKQTTAVDEVLTPQLLLKCKSSLYTKSVYFTGVMTKNSISRRPISIQKIKEELFALSYICKIFIKQKPSLQFLPVNKYLHYLIMTYDEVIKNNSMLSIKRVIENEIEEYCSYISLSNSLRGKSLIISTKIFLLNNFKIVYPFTIGIFRTVIKIQYFFKLVFNYNYKIIKYSI